MSVTPPSLTGAQAGALADLSERHLRRLCAAGEGPPQAPDGSFPVAPFAAWQRKRLKTEFGVDESGQAYSFTTERGRLTKAQADKAEMEAAELAGELVRKDIVAEELGRRIMTARSLLLALPSKIAQRIGDPGRTAAIQALAQEVVYAALYELAGDNPDGTRKPATQQRPKPRATKKKARGRK